MDSQNPSSQPPSSVGADLRVRPDGVRPDGVRPRRVRSAPRLQTRLATAFAILALLSSILVSLVLTITIRNQLLADIRDRVQDAVAIGALQVDGDAHSTLVDSDQEGGDTYNQLKSVLQNIRDAGLNYRFVYTLRFYPADQTMYFIVDAETDPELISHLMDAYTDLPPEITKILSTLDAPYVEPDFYTDEWGRWLTGYAPVYTSDGHVDAVLAMDVDASLVIAQTNRFVWISLIILAALIPFVVLVGWQLGKRISEPIVRLTQGAEIITAGDLDHTVQLTTRDETSRLAQAFNTMTARLRDTIGGLEQTVTDRTRDVELRSSYLRAAAEVGRAATSILDSPQLIQQVVESIRTRFDLYYVGLFLVDSAAEYAVLQAGTGQAGKAMLARSHRIRIGEGMIGWSVANKRPRVALEAAEDAVRLVTDLLPLTRSEAALPLISRTRVLGALTVQSERSGLFTPEIISVLQTMADQVALALDNARLFSESEAALDALQRSFGEVRQKAWSDLLSTRQTLGYRLDQDGLHPLLPDALLPVRAHGVRPDTVLKLPIRLRDQVLGVIEARKPDHAGPWNQDEIEQLTSLVDQLSVALENARLYEDTQTRADHERILAEITTKVRATTDINTILQTAVLELATALNVPQGSIRLQAPGPDVEPPDNPPPDGPVRAHLGVRPLGRPQMEDQPMSNDTQTEETRPVPPGLDLRLRLLRRLADPIRNASWVFLALALALAIGLAISIYQALVYPVVNGAAWQLYLVAVGAGVLTGLSALAATLSRRTRPAYTIWLTLLSLQIGFVFCSLFVSGLGFWLALGVVMATLSITSLCLPSTPVGADLRVRPDGVRPDGVRPSAGFPSRPAFLPNGLGVLAAFAVLAVDSYFPRLQVDPLSIFTYLTIAGAALASLLFLGTLIAFFPTYSLRLKITITVFSASILSIALLSALYNLTTRQSLINAVDQTLLLASRQTARDIDAYFQQITARLTAQAITPSLTLYLNLPPEERLPNSTTRTYLLTQRSLYGARYYALLDSQGYVVLHTQLVDTSQFPPYLGLPEAVTTAVQQTTSTGAIYLSPVLFPAPTEDPYFIAAARVRDALGEQIGTLLAAFPLDSIQAIVAAANDSAGNGSYAILIDDNYLRLAHGRDPTALYQLLAQPSDPAAQSLVDALLDDQRLPAQTVLDDPSASDAGFAGIAASYPDFVAGLQSLNQQPSFTSHDTFTGDTLNAVAATRLNSRPWVLAFLQAQPAILAPITAQTRLTLLLAVLVAGLAVLASTLLARLVADPIIRITSIAERAAAGNLYLQASAASADEIGALGLAFNSMINQLRHTLQGLETRVAERTAELAQASDQLQYRADHLQAVAELAHAIAAIQDPAELLPRLTHEISTRFGYYHTGIFLLNADQTYAVLEATNSAGGARMLARHHRLRVGQVGIVGYVAGTGQPRIALDVGQDAVFFDNPDLPDTRSEISLPLKVGEQIIGVLDVQSVQPAAFSQDDIALLSTLADQVAMAIQNTRLYADSLRTVHELQLAQRQYLQERWSQIAAERSTVGYQLDFGRLQALPPASAPASAPLAPALELQQPGLENRPGRLVVPLALRNQVIGLIDLQDVDPSRAWTPQELAFARSVADQVALALENARLLEETRRRAERERLVSDITTRLRVSNDPQTILDTALSELRQALQVKSVQVRLRSPDSQPDHPTENRGEV